MEDKPGGIGASQEQSPGVESVGFSAYADRLSQTLPEVAGKLESIKAAGQDILERFHIRPELFEDEGRSFVFTAIAARAAEQSNAADAKAEEVAFLTRAVEMLAYKFSPDFSEFRSLMERGGTADDSRNKHLYDKYTDSQLSQEVKKAISNSQILGDVKEGLQIAPDNEDDFEVRVLGLADYGHLFGLEIEPVDWEAVADDPVEYLRVSQEYNRTSKELSDWKNGLIQRGEEFAKATGQESLFFAWISFIDGKKNLCLPMPLAEKLLDPGLTKNASYYDSDQRGRDFAALKHEYVHTQGGLTLDEGIIFGINLEEMRAEHFSGNRMGYTDTKSFFLDVATVTGLFLPDVFDKYPKGGSQQEVFSEIAAKTGLSGFLEVIMATPSDYLGKTGSKELDERLMEVRNHLGGYDGILQRLYGRAVEAGQGPEIEARLRQQAEIWGRLDLENVVAHKRAQGLNLVTDMRLKHIKK